MRKRRDKVKRGPVISPLRSQGVLMDQEGNRVTFVFPDHRTVQCTLENRDGDLVLNVQTHPGAVVIWPNMTNEVDIIPARAP